MKNEYLGSRLDDFLESEGLLAECQAESIKKVLAWQIEQYLKENHVNKTQFAKELQTSRSQLNRLLDPTNVSLNLTTLAEVAAAIGKRVEVKLV